MNTTQLIRRAARECRSAQTRRAAVEALVVKGDAELRVVLGRVVRRDPDASNRAYAACILERLDAAGRSLSA